MTKISLVKDVHFKKLVLTGAEDCRPIIPSMTCNPSREGNGGQERALDQT
jgi:hypothetical protein